MLTRLAGADPSLLHAPDDQGFYALQWAALNLPGVEPERVVLGDYSRE